MLKIPNHTCTSVRLLYGYYKINIARIAKAALHKCPGKSSLNVNHIFPVYPSDRSVLSVLVVLSVLSVLFVLSVVFLSGCSYQIPPQKTSLKRLNINI